MTRFYSDGVTVPQVGDVLTSGVSTTGADVTGWTVTGVYTGGAYDNPAFPNVMVQFMPPSSPPRKCKSESIQD